MIISDKMSFKSNQQIMNAKHSIKVRNKGILCLEYLMDSNLDDPLTIKDRLAYIETAIRAPKLSQHVSTVIIDEDTFHNLKIGKIHIVPYLTSKNVIVGISCTERFPITRCSVYFGNKIKSRMFKHKLGLSGLDDLPKRLTEYRKKGCVLAKCRISFELTGLIIPSIVIEANTCDAALFALQCQKRQLLPIIEVDLISNGQPISRYYKSLVEILSELKYKLHLYNVNLEEIILITQIAFSELMIDGAECTAANRAKETLKLLYHSLPPMIDTIIFKKANQDTNSNLINYLKTIKNIHPERMHIYFTMAFTDRQIKLTVDKFDNQGKEMVTKKIFAAIGNLFHRMSINSLFMPN